MFRLVIAFILAALVIATGALNGCQISKFKTSHVIVMMVENLGVQQIDCAHDGSFPDTSVHSGIQILCRESIRFTHAFSTSPLAAPAMASILTGMYPIEHGLRHHGLSYLSGQIETLAEQAEGKGYSTAFFSGGAPALRKYNIHQGFDLFDDNINPSQNSFFRGIESLLESYIDWKKDIGNKPSLSFFYVPDLLFPETSSQNYLGEVRDKTFESQLAKIDENIYNLITRLKKEGTWNQTSLVLVGLNGFSQYPRPGELDNTSLFADRTQVGLLIKPAGRHNDEGLSWSFDQNVSLADLGKTLFDILDLKAPISQMENFPIFSLKRVIEDLHYELPVRPLLMESAWADWQENLGIRYAISWDQFLFVLDEKIQIFNSLTDRFELSPMKPGDPGIHEITDEVLALQAKYHLIPWKGLPRDTELKWQALSERLAHRLRDIPVIAQRYSQELLKQQRWEELKKWAEGMKLRDYEIIAELNSANQSAKEILSLHKKLSDPCLRKDLKKCEDPLALDLLRWFKDPKNESYQKRFQRSYQQLKVDQNISEKNWKLQGIWDISKKTQKDLEITSMLLALPEMRSFR